MRNTLLSLLAAILVLSGCGGPSRDQSVEPLAAQQPNAGLTDAFGFKTTLDPARWKEIERTTGTLVLLYQPEGKVCDERECSRLTLAVPAPGTDGNYYHSIVDAEFSATTWCEDGLTAIAPSVRQPTDFMVGGEASEYFISSPCGVNVQPRSFSLYFPKKYLVIRFDESASGASFEETGLDAALSGAVW